MISMFWKKSTFRSSQQRQSRKNGKANQGALVSRKPKEWQEEGMWQGVCGARKLR